MSNRADRRNQRTGGQQNPIQASRMQPQVRKAGITNKRKEKKGRSR